MDENKILLEVGLDHSGVRKALDAVRNQSKRFWTDIGKGAQKYGNVVKNLGKPKFTGRVVDQIKKVAQEYRQFDKVMRNYTTLIDKADKRLSTASGKRREEVKKEIADLRRLQQMRIGEEKMTIAGRLRVLRYKSKGVAQAGREKLGRLAQDTDGKEIAKLTGAAITGAFATGVALFRKDLKGAVGEAVQVAGKSWQAGFGALGKSANMFSRASTNLGKWFQRKGAERGGAAGAGLSGIGGVAKVVGGLSKSIGPILNTVSKLGPLLSMASSSVMSLVQLFIDAEAAAKEMNKQALQMSGTGDFLARNYGRGGAAIADMGDTLQKMRNDATALSNLEWGISKEDHMNFLSTMGAEGVSIKDLDEQFQTAQGHAKSFGGAVQVAVAYSRQFGISLQELGQFQAEMMTEQGASLDTVERQFSQMAREAGEAGIASNKFFAIIRGVSADLNLYNSRMEDAVKLLGRLGRVMNPRNAGKFMSTLVRGFKDKSRTDLVKMNLLNDSRGGEIVKRDLNRRAAKLAEDIGGGATAADVLNNSKTSAELLKNVAPDQQGTLREALIELRQDSKMNQKGMFGSSMAMANLSPGAAAQMMENALIKFGSRNPDGTRKKLADVAGEIGPEMMAEQLGISRDELNGRIKMAAALDDQRDDLKKNLKDEKVRLKLEKAGIKLTGNLAKDQQAIDNAGYDSILETLDKDAQDELKHSNEVIDYNKQTSQYTSTIMDKLGVLVDFLMNQIYNVMNGVWEAVLDVADLLDIAGTNKDQRDKDKLEARVNKTRNKELMDLAVKSRNTADFMSKAKETGIFKDHDAALSTKGILDLDAKKKDLIRQYESRPLSDVDGKAALQKQIDEVTKQYEAASEVFGHAVAGIDRQLGGSLKGEDRNRARAGKVFGAMGGFDNAKKDKVAKSLIEGKDLGAALDSAGLSQDEQVKVLKSIRDTSLTGEQLAQILADYSKTTGRSQAEVTREAREKEEAIARARDPKAKIDPAPVPAASAVTTGVAPIPANNASAVAAAARVEAPMTEKQGAQTLSTLDEVQTSLRQKGIKIDQSFLRDKFWSNGYDAVLEANREALLEYFLYSKMDADAVAGGLKDGKFTSKDFGRSALDVAAKTGKAPTLDGFASGGVIPQPKSPDSVFVAAKPGETITPAGKGGGQSGINIPISVNGPGGQELANMMRTAAINVIHEWQRKQRYT